MGLLGLTAEWGAPLANSPMAMGLPPDSQGSVWVACAGLGRFPVAPEGFNAVLCQLARWFYPFGSGAHCNNYCCLSMRLLCCQDVKGNAERYNQQAGPNLKGRGT